MLGARDYAGQYDQEPVPIGGAVFRDHWWRYYREAPAQLQPPPHQSGWGA